MRFETRSQFIENHPTRVHNDNPMVDVVCLVNHKNSGIPMLSVNSVFNRHCP